MKLRLFIGSSSERKAVARALAQALRPQYDVTVWYKDVFDAGTFVLPKLQEHADRAHLAIFVYAPDDKLTLRDTEYSQPRDNVIFELGMFMSKLGSGACFLLVPTDLPKDVNAMRIPSDLFGLTTLRYSAKRFGKAPQAALREAVHGFKDAHSKLNTDRGARPDVGGAWSLTWVVESRHFELLNQHKLELVQVGQRVLGTYRAHRIDGSSIPVQFDGTLVDHNLLGQWSTNGYNGAFQLRVDRDWREMTGRWIGPSNEEGIKTGLYRWVRK